LLSLFGTAVVIYLICKKFGGYPAAMSGSLAYVLFSSNTAIEGNFSNTEHFMVLPITLSLYFFINGLETKNMKYYVLAGFFSCMAVFVKQTAVFNLILIVLFMLLSEFYNKKFSLYDLIKKYFFLFIGGFILAIPIFLFFILQNSFNQFYFWVVQYPLMYSGAAHNFIFMLLQLVDEREIFQKMYLVWSLAFAAFLFVFVHLKQRRWNLNRNLRDILLVLWFFASFIGVMMGGRFYQHYFIQVLPALCILLGYSIGFSKIFNSKKDMASFQGIIIIVFIILGLIFPLLQVGYNYVYRVVNEPPSTDYQIISEYIKNNTFEGDEIYVWGYAPQIYVLSGRKSFNEAVHFFPLSGASAIETNYENTIVNWTRKEFINDLKIHPPRYIIVENYYGRDIDEFKEFDEFFRTNYVADINISGAQIYKIK
jgi:4-amino-4-deoxy-L-arabinose transferase-like glycosyltransferase